jgi:hypothetical protein
MDTTDRSKDRYEEFSASIVSYFATCVTKTTPLFTTDAEGLWDAYLNNIPEYARQHYNCHSCRHFINHFGSLVTISEGGNTFSPLWDVMGVPELFTESVKALRKIVLTSRVTGVFTSKEAALGYPVTGEWSHIYVRLPTAKVFKSLVKTPFQEMAEKHEDFKMLMLALSEYPVEIVDQAVNLLQSESLYRSDKFLGVAKWFKELHEKRASAKSSERKTNMVWVAVATAHAGYCHVKSSMIGTLLDDLRSGLTFTEVSRRFSEKMNPAQYMRAQVAPAQGNIDNAEKIIEKLGLADSLKRRYATLDEIPVFEWRDVKSIPTAIKPGKVFSMVTPKKDVPVSNDLQLPTTTMTWEKFNRTVLPTADSIEVKVDNPNRFVALVTASVQPCTNLLQWNNPFSWYYHGGIDGEIKRRVESAGGRYEGNEIRCSLIWEGYTDLDLHCYTPSGIDIYYGHRRDNYGGWLDVDANGGHATTKTPVENIRWSIARSGHYRFWVHNFCERGNGKTQYRVELQINNQIYVYNGVASTTGYQQFVFEFDFVHGLARLVELIGSMINISSENSWNISAGDFVKVTGIVKSPNLWGDNPIVQSGQHMFFLLDGCKDKSEGKGRGFFNEMLKSELREIRKTLEAYTANTPIEGSDNASACGLGYSKDSEWNLVLRVKSDTGSRFVKIDRWD